MHAPGGSPVPNSTRGDAARQAVFHSAEWYDRSINWQARLEREIPLLCEVFGPPGRGGLLDAGCGTARQAVALAERGYRVTGADSSEDMLELARRQAANSGADVRFVCCPYGRLTDHLEPGFDGVYCLGNSLAAAASAEGVGLAIRNFAAMLRPEGRLFVQVLNFPPMRGQSPCVKGPRVVTVDGIEHVSIRTYHFHPDPAAGPEGRVEVVNTTLWNDGAWRRHSRSGNLYPLTSDELTEWCRAAGLEVSETYGAYDRTAFDPANSSDLLLIAQRTA